MQKLEPPRAVWLMVAAAGVDATLAALTPLLSRDDVIIDGGNSYYRDDIRRAEGAGRRRHPLRRRRHLGRRVGQGARLLPDDRRRRGRRARGSIRSSPRWPRRSTSAPRTPGRTGPPTPAEHGYLHCGPSGAGHFVKMVHNGIEYGLMAAYAEGLNILRHANAGKDKRAVDAETAPLQEPELYQYDLDLRDIAEVWRRGSVIASWLLDLTAAALVRRPRAGRVQRPRLRLGRGSLDAEGRHRRGRAGADPVDRHQRAVRLARRGRVRGPRAVGAALRVRRPPGEAHPMTAPAAGALRRTRWCSSAPPAIWPTSRSSRRCRRWCARGPERAGRRRRPSRAGRSTSCGRGRATASSTTAASIAARSTSWARSCATSTATTPTQATFDAVRRELGAAKRPLHYLAIPPSAFPASSTGSAGRVARRWRAWRWRSRSVATSPRRGR